MSKEKLITITDQKGELSITITGFTGIEILGICKVLEIQGVKIASQTKNAITNE